MMERGEYIQELTWASISQKEKHPGRSEISAEVSKPGEEAIKWEELCVKTQEINCFCLEIAGGEKLFAY